MPYRRLPNTDLARTRALKNALLASMQINPRELAFSQNNYLALKSFIPYFEQTMQQYQQNKERQAQTGKKLQKQFRDARMYVSHFLQIINFCILRGELKPEIRKYYGMEEADKSVPEIGTEQQLIIWGERLIKGEEARMHTGAMRIYNPSLAVVKAKYEKFCELYNAHKDLLTTSQKLHEKVNEFRVNADKLILNIWNEVEQTYEKLPPDEKREKCKKYGLIYIYRNSEI